MVPLDDRDLAILKILATEGRISKTLLADRVGLSATPCWNRLKKMEKVGLIQSYRAQINLRKLAPHVTIFVTVEISNHTAASFRAFEDAVSKSDEITGCWALGGGFDYLLQIVTRDIDEYQRLVDELLEARIGLARYYTYVVTKNVKDDAMPPIENLMRGMLSK